MGVFVLNVHSRVGDWGVIGSDESIQSVLLPHQRLVATRGAVPHAVGVAGQQLEEFFAGTRRDFDVAMATSSATSFQREVWAALCDIPYGEVRTYAEVASAVGRPNAARAVGNANHANPWPVIVPCHRVVGSSGLGGYGGGENVKRYLLELEGVRVD